MTHTVHMDCPYRPGTARRLGLRRPEPPPRLVLQVDRELTDAEYVELAERWEVAMRSVVTTHAILPDDSRLTWGAASGAGWTVTSGTTAPRRRWWQRRNR